MRRFVFVKCVAYLVSTSSANGGRGFWFHNAFRSIGKIITISSGITFCSRGGEAECRTYGQGTPAAFSAGS